MLRKLIAAIRRKEASVETVDLPGGIKHWYDPAAVTPDAGRSNLVIRDEEPKAKGTYRVPHRVIGNNTVLAARNALISIETAREWARLGYLNDPALVECKPFDPRDGVKSETADQTRVELSGEPT